MFHQDIRSLDQKSLLSDLVVVGGGAGRGLLCDYRGAGRIVGGSNSGPSGLGGECLE